MARLQFNPDITHLKAVDFLDHYRKCSCEKCQSSADEIQEMYIDNRKKYSDAYYDGLIKN